MTLPAHPAQAEDSTTRLPSIITSFIDSDGGNCFTRRLHTRHIRQLVRFLPSFGYLPSSLNTALFACINYCFLTSPFVLREKKSVIVLADQYHGRSQFGFGICRPTHTRGDLHTIPRHLMTFRFGFTLFLRQGHAPFLCRCGSTSTRTTSG